MPEPCSIFFAPGGQTKLEEEGRLGTWWGAGGQGTPRKPQWGSRAPLPVLLAHSCACTAAAPRHLPAVPVPNLQPRALPLFFFSSPKGRGEIALGCEVGVWGRTAQRGSRRHSFPHISRSSQEPTQPWAPIGRIRNLSYFVASHKPGQEFGGCGLRDGRSKELRATQQVWCLPGAAPASLPQTP